MGFEILEDAVYATVHVPVANVQEVGLKVPPTPPSLQVIVPVGEVGELDVSVTVVVKVTWPPADTEFGFDTTVREVLSRVMALFVVALFPVLVALLAIAWETSEPFENKEENITTLKRQIVRMFFILVFVFGNWKLKLFRMRSVVMIGFTLIIRYGPLFTNIVTEQCLTNTISQID